MSTNTITRTTRHMSMNIAGMLRNFKGKSIAGIIIDDNGKEMSDVKAREFLAECQAKGWKKLPCGDCEGFDPFGNGCPGHPVEEETKTTSAENAQVEIKSSKIDNTDPFYAAALSSPALSYQEKKKDKFKYPERFNGRVPLIVSLIKNVKSDLPVVITKGHDLSIPSGKEVFVWVNSYGAVTAILPNNERLGLMPDEFVVIEWHPLSNHKS